MNRLMKPCGLRSDGNLLVAVDSPATLKLLVNLFNRQSLNVRVVSNGPAALALARREPPDLVLLGVNLPRLDGYEVCARLKADLATQAIPVLLVSAPDGEIDKAKVFSAGGADYLTRPFHLEEVEARVWAHLELRRQARRLWEYEGHLQELERAKHGLERLVGQDMRSPLMALKAALALLQPPPLAGQRAGLAALDYAQRAMADLAAMADRVRDLSLWEAGGLPLYRQNLDLVATVAAAVRSLAALAGTRRVELQAPPSLPLAYDPELISRVLVTLLTNAYKLTPQTGKVALAVAGHRDQVRVSISDSGSAIPPEQHQIVFEKFSPMELHQRDVSNGLGLAFCKLAVEAHGGRVGVESQPGHGNTFWFTLPTGKSAERPARKPAPRGHGCQPSSRP